MEERGKEKFLDLFFFFFGGAGIFLHNLTQALYMTVQLSPSQACSIRSHLDNGRHTHTKKMLFFSHVV